MPEDQVVELRLKDVEPITTILKTLVAQLAEWLEDGTLMPTDPGYLRLVAALAEAGVEFTLEEPSW